jgi:MATE family multidrug resistance protein
MASTISQWLGAVAGIILIALKMGFSAEIVLRDALKLIRIGGDLFVRTGILTLFLAYTTRAANGISPDAGAAHQVIRQVWVFTSLALDAYASTVQSLVGYFVGQKSISWVKQVIQVSMIWSLSTGVILAGLMWWGRDFVVEFVVPTASISAFLPAWGVSSLSQPLNSLAFLTDGIHWGTGDYRYIRDAMILSSLVGIGGLWIIEKSDHPALHQVWIATGVWIILRAIFGTLRIWPGIGNSLFRSQN